MQLLNVCFGGTLYQDLPSQHPGALGHAQDMAIRSQLNPSGEAGVRVAAGAAAGGGTPVRQQLPSPGRRTPAPGFTVTATAADGVVEGVEAPGRNLYAVQWHPEDLVERHPRFRPLFRHLVEQAERFAER